VTSALIFIKCLGSDGCEDGVSGRFETTQQQESHRQPQQQIHEPFHIRHQPPAIVKQDSMTSFLQQQPFGIFGQGKLCSFCDL